jgi:integrase
MNDAQVKALRCDGGPFVERSVDPAYPGLRLRVTAGDPPVKTWYLVYRVRGERKQNRLKLGRYAQGGGGMTLAEARIQARSHLTTADKREDPKALIAAREKSDVTVADLMALFLVDKEFQERTEHTQETYAQIFRDYLGAPAEDGGRATGIARMSVTDTDAIRAGVLAAVKATGEDEKKPTANKILQFSKRLFRWALEKEHITAAQFPHALIVKRKPFAEVVRDHVYTHEEIRAIVKAQMQDGSPVFRSYWMLLWHTGARERNIRRMRWELSGAAGTDRKDQGATVPGLFMPAKEMKARRAEIIPLTAAALAVLAQVKPWTGAHEWVHPRSATAPTRGSTSPPGRPPARAR